MRGLPQQGPSLRNLAKTESEMSRLLPGVLAMAAIVVASNILVQFLFGQWLTWGAFTYPLAFLVTDVMNRVYGPATARKVVFAGFVTGVICSLIGTQIQGEFGPLVTLRIAMGSGIAFACLCDAVDWARNRGRPMPESGVERLAQDPGDFYRGKTINMIIGTGPAKPRNAAAPPAAGSTILATTR